MMRGDEIGRVRNLLKKYGLSFGELSATNLDEYL